MFGRAWGGAEPFRNRLFDRGDLKYVVLDLLKEKPRHGYEIIRALQDQCGGWYTPSPGAVYPTLEMLSDMDYVTSAVQDGKKIYSITPAGQEFLAERRQMTDEIRERIGNWWGGDARAEFADIRREVKQFGQLFDKRLRTQWRDPAKLRRIREVVARARVDIESILAEQGPL